MGHCRRNANSQGVNYFHLLVFKSKVLEAHLYNTCGGELSGSSSHSSTDDEEHTEAASLAMATSKTFHDELEANADEAIAILKRHKDFIHKQTLSLKQHCKKSSYLPQTVSSKRSIGKDDELQLEDVCNVQKKESQSIKNRKRKLKKKRAKEKRVKMSEGQQN